MRTAQCTCGDLRAETAAEPCHVIMCHCHECQRRTGAPFGVSAYFEKDQVRTTGPATAYTRDSDSGREFASFFCPRCGTSVYWFVAFDPDLIGVAVRCFTDPGFPEPQRSVFECRKHNWVDAPAAATRFDTTSFKA